MNQNIFNTVRVSGKIREEVCIFKKFLSDNIHNKEIFYECINKINNVWDSILKDSFKNLIVKYIQEYDLQNKKETDLRNEMMKVADDINADNLTLENINITPNLTSLTYSFSKNTISKRKRASRKR
tara:strand:- start:682 stop:1059 length:378 start_codon:yes stop_codon:yes gene_type:complete